MHTGWFESGVVRHADSNDYHKGKSLCSQVPRNRRFHTPDRAVPGNTRVSQKAEERRKEHGPAPFPGVFVGEGMGQEGRYPD